MEDWNEWAPEACLINLVWGGRENRTEPDSEHFLAWLCCVFFRISFIGVNFFSMSGKSTKIIIACKIFYCLIQAFFFSVCVFMNDFCSSKPLSYRKYATTILVWPFLYRLSCYGTVAYDSINQSYQLRALQSLLQCLICTCIIHWCMKSLEISIDIWMFFILMHLSLQIIFSQTSDFILYLCTLSSLIAFYVCIVYSMAFILCNIYTYSRTNFLAFGCV